jgi:dTDP-4-amino-4,6-dideoxygalactose transaminase
VTFGFINGGLSAKLDGLELLTSVQASLKPVLVEPTIWTYNIDPLKIDERIIARIAVVLIVHLYGKCCNVELLLQLCWKHG